MQGKSYIVKCCSLLEISLVNELVFGQKTSRAKMYLTTCRNGVGFLQMRFET